MNQKINKATPLEHPIIFFDGVCGMCNTFVNLMLKVDRKHLFHFAPLQGITAKQMLPSLDQDPLNWSMLYLDERGLHDESDASLEVYRRLGGCWWFLCLLLFIPRVIRNPAYRMLARNRYRLFGKKESCRMPTEQEHARFLD